MMMMRGPMISPALLLVGLFLTPILSQLTPTGFVDVATPTHVAGWACLPSQPTRALFVGVFVDNNRVALIPANLQRQDVAGVCGGNAFHGFDYTFSGGVSATLSNGLSHNVSVFAAPSSDGIVRTQLNSSPVTVVSANALPHGFLDVANGTTAAGWACDPNDFTRTLRVDFYVDGNVFAGSVNAQMQREPAVAAQCGGNALHGFVFNWPQNILTLLRNGQPHNISAFAINFPTGTNPPLSGSPISLPAAPNTLPRGNLDVANLTLASGWACDPDVPNQALQVHFYIDNNFIAATTANLPREAAVGAQCGGNSMHGFSFTWPASALQILTNGQPHIVHAYAINVPTGTNPELSNSPMTISPPVVRSNLPPIGFLDVANATLAAGWTCDPDIPNQALQVQFFIDNTFIASTTANLAREVAVGAQCGGNSMHGFVFTWPANVQQVLSNGQTHTIQALAVNVPTGTNPQLTGSPVTFTAPVVPNTLPRGNLDIANATLASGWACDPDVPTQPLQVHLYINGTFIASTTANLAREAAVGAQCGGNSMHGFAFTWPANVRQMLSNGQTHTIRAYAINVPTGTNPELSNSPISFNVPIVRENLPPIGFLDIANLTLAAGWTCDPDVPAQALQVQFYVDNNFVASTTANLPREAAVGAQCGGNAMHGFSFTWPTSVQQLLNNGQSHSIQAFSVNVPTGTNPQLTNSPVTVINALPRGFLDVGNATLASGWACDPDIPTQPLQVHFYIDNNFVAATTANLAREAAVGAQCGGNSMHGFVFTWPANVQQLLSNGQPHSVQAFAINVPTGTNPQLSNSPMQVLVPISNTLPRGFLDTATTTSATGWTCDPDVPNQALEVHFYIDNNFIAATTANLAREAAVGAQCGGNSNHGFSFIWPANVQQLLTNGQPHTVRAFAINVPTGTNPELSNSPRTVSV